MAVVYGDEGFAMKPGEKCGRARANLKTRAKAGAGGRNLSNGGGVYVVSALAWVGAAAAPGA